MSVAGRRPGLARRRRLGDRVHRLPRPVVARRRHEPGEVVPELVDRALVADDHPGAAPGGGLREAPAIRAGGDDVRADVAESGQAAVVGEGAEPAQPPPSDVLEEDALHGVLGAELEDLLEPGLDRTFHCPNSRTG